MKKILELILIGSSVFLAISSCNQTMNVASKGNSSKSIAIANPTEIKGDTLLPPIEFKIEEMGDFFRIKF